MAEAVKLRAVPFSLETLPDGWFSKVQISALYQLVLATDGPILEVGSWIGRSTTVIGHALRNRPEPVEFHTVDYGISSLEEWQEKFGSSLLNKPNAERYLPHVTREGGSLSSLRENLSVRGMLDLVSIHKGDFHNVAPKIGYSLIFCDATHNRREIDTNVPALIAMLKPGGVLACDDISDELYEYLISKFSFRWNHRAALLFYGEPELTTA